MKNLAILWGITLLWCLAFCKSELVSVQVFVITLMFIPAACALFFAWRERVRLSYFSRPGWSYVRVALLGTLLALFLIALHLPLAGWSGTERLRSHFETLPQNMSDPLFIMMTVGWTSGIVVIAALTFNMLIAMGEELMWRGYLYQKFEHLGFVRSSLLVGLIWGVWNIPMVYLIGLNYPYYPLLGVVVMIIYCVALSPLLHYIRLRTGSVALPAVFRGTLNAFVPFTYLVLKNPHPYLASPTGLSGIVVLALLSTFLLIRRGMPTKTIQPLKKSTP